MMPWFRNSLISMAFGGLLLVPCVLFAAGMVSALYFAIGLILVGYLLLLIINFEAGFLTLIFIRSSLDIIKYAGGGDSGFNAAAAASVALIVLGVFYVLYRKINLFAFRETLPFLIFLGVCGIGVLISEDAGESVSDWLRLVSVFSVYILTRGIAVTRKKIRIFLVVALLSALVPVVFAYYQLLTGQAFVTFGRQIRLTGTFYHPNAFASYLIIVLIFCTAQLLERRPLVNRRFLFFMVAPVFLVFVLTFSRGAWIAFVISMMFMGAIRYRRILVALPVVLILVTLTVPAVRDRVTDVFENNDRRGRDAWTWRMDEWGEIFTMVGERPIFGHGLSMVLVKRGVLAHNDYLRILTELGIVGFLAYCFLAFRLMQGTWRDYRRAGEGALGSLQVGLLAMIFGFLVRQIADNTLRNTVVMIYFWIFIALARNAMILYMPKRSLDDTAEQDAEMMQ